MSYQKHGAILILAISLLIWQGCAVGPDYERPKFEMGVPSEWSPATDEIKDPAVTMSSALPPGHSQANWKWW